MLYSQFNFTLQSLISCFDCCNYFHNKINPIIHHTINQSLNMAVDRGLGEGTSLALVL